MGFLANKAKMGCCVTGLLSVLMGALGSEGVPRHFMLGYSHVLLSAILAIRGWGPCEMWVASMQGWVAFQHRM